MMLSIMALMATASPAAAHGRGSDATNFLSVITSAPEDDGVTFEIVNSDEYLLVRNDGEEEVAVAGYTGEPYLRIGPDGAWRNENSPATYLNADRYGQTVVPRGVDGDAEPRWEQVSSEGAFAWHDHRIHWMATTNPPVVQTDPASRHLVNEWTVPVEIGGRPAEIIGELYWVPGSGPLPWLITALVLLSVPIGWALWRTRPDVGSGRWRGLSLVSGTVLLLLAIANGIHLVDDLVATPIPLTQSITSALQTAFFISIAMYAAFRTIIGGEGAFVALGAGTGAIFIGQGLLYASVLAASQTATVFPEFLTRGVIAASLAQIVPLGIASVLGTRALLPQWDDEPDDVPSAVVSGE
ncbi:hypothetical protein [Euzebya sp.]|uniref:hypothetical protein n=1 Tax=Euzebya sp. TaxID=1971409 RepID=UPI003513405E